MEQYSSLIIAALIGLVTSLGAYAVLLPYFKKFNMNQTVSEYALQDYKEKPITPTMGGIVFVLIGIIASLILNQFNLSNVSYWLVMLTFFLFFVVGFMDDYKIVKEGKNNGLSEKLKMGFQLVMASVVGLIYMKYFPTSITFPLLSWTLNLGWLYFPLILFMLSGASNAVNITDGVDGLSSSTFSIALFFFMILAYWQNQTHLAVFCATLLGALIGYFVFNKKPAKIYMGDAGSLALGGLIACLGMVLKQEIALIFIAIVFILETLIVMIQLTSVKLRHKKVFPYTPIHYTFILKGFSENQVNLLFCLVGLIGGLFGLYLGWQII